MTGVEVFGHFQGVDHAGEVAAQALYHGQALTARTQRLRDTMEQAAREEGDHLRWCHKRVEELGLVAHPSRGEFRSIVGAIGEKTPQIQQQLAVCDRHR